MVFRFSSLIKVDKEKYLVHKKSIMEQREIIDSKNDELLDGIKYAKRIKEAFMFDELDLREIFANSFIKTKSILEVGGTFYWFKLDIGSVDIIVGKSDNTGVPGSMINFVAVNIFMNIFSDENIHYTEAIGKFEDRFERYIDNRSRLKNEKIELLHVHIDTRKNILWAKGVNTMISIKNKDYEYVSCLHLSRDKCIEPNSSRIPYDTFRYRLEEGYYVYCSTGTLIPEKKVNIDALVRLKTEDIVNDISDDFTIIGFEYHGF